MINPLIIDAVFIAVLAAAFFAGRARGIIKMAWSLAAWLITLILALTLAAPVGELAESSSYADAVQERLEQRINDKLLDEIKHGKYSPQSAAEYVGIPKTLIPENIPLLSALYSGAAEKTAGELSKSIAGYMIHTLAKPASFILLILLIRIVMAVLYRLLNIASRLPVLNGANRLLGGIAGLIGALLAIYLVLAFIAVFIGGEYGLLIGRTYLVKYFYNDNILLYLIK